MAETWRDHDPDVEGDLPEWPDDDSGLADVDDEEFARAIREGRRSSRRDDVVAR